MIPVLLISPDQFRRKPQIGTPDCMTWGALAEFLSKPMIGDWKDIAGGIAFGTYSDNARRKAGIVPGSILVSAVDIDGGIAPAVLAAAVASTSAIVVETFSSTPEDPRCRLFVELTEGVDVATYEAVHAILRRKLRRLGAAVDEGAKDASRLSYLPVRRPDADYQFFRTTGAPIDARRMIDAQPKPKAVTVEPRTIRHQDRYVQAALTRAAAEVASASKGQRHEVLNKEAWSLARLGLTVVEIESALLPSAVAVMGEARRGEAKRTIAEAVEARKAS